MVRKTNTFKPASKTHVTTRANKTNTRRTNVPMAHVVQSRTFTGRHLLIKQTMSQRHATAFARGTRIFGRVTAVNGSHVVVRLPNGTERTFLSNDHPRVGGNVVAFARGADVSRFETEDRFFRTGELDRDRLTFRVANGVTNTFVINQVRPVGNRVIFFARDEAAVIDPDVVFVNSARFDDDAVTFVQPSGVLVPMAITNVALLPGGQLAFVTTDEVTPTFVPAPVSFVGELMSLTGNLASFLLPDGSVRSLVAAGPLPPVDTTMVVLENGDEVVGYEPAFTRFTGQVVAVDNGETVFMLPDGTLRTLVYAQPVPVGSRVVVYEDGMRVQRLVTVY